MTKTSVNITAIIEYDVGMEAIVAGKKVENKVFAHPLPYNIIPHIDVFQENAYTKEEMKVLLSYHFCTLLLGKYELKLLLH